MKTYLEEYQDLIESGGVIVGYWIRREMENLIHDLEDPRFFYDPEDAQKRMAWMERFCLQTKQPFYKVPLKLMPWQKAWLEALYGFKMQDSGKRRFVEGLLEVGRKNGKSFCFAADIAYDLYCGAGGQDIGIGSNDEKQAKIIDEDVRKICGYIDPRERRTRKNIVKIENVARNVTVFRMTNGMSNKDGRLISKFILDESHECHEENNANALAAAAEESMTTVEEPLFINCTTQGFHRECYLDYTINRAKAVISGESEDYRFLPFLYEQDNEQEVWDDESSWEKSNPSLRYGVKKIDQLRRKVELAKTDKATRITVLTKEFNIAQSSYEGWLMLEDYDYPQVAFDLEDFRGGYCMASVDLSATTDLTSVKVLLMKAGDRTKYILSHYFIPESKLAQSDDASAGAEYKEWARQGLMTIHEGTEVDVAAVADWIYQLYRDYKIKPFKVAFDQRFAKTFIERCEYLGLETEMILQGRALSSAMKLTESELKNRLVNYCENPIDKWCLRNCCVKVDNVGNIQPVKIAGQHSKRIDGALTLIMLYEIFRRYRSDFMTKVGG